jgi:hypothetical protein
VEFHGPWLGESRGYFVDWVTQLWVRITGSPIDLAGESWLAGPSGNTREIGSDFFQILAEREGLRIRPTGASTGLMESFKALAGPGFDPAAVHPLVRSFYEETAGFSLDVWSEWCGFFQPFGRLLAIFFSRRLKQMNVPLEPLSTSRGMSSAVLQLEDPKTGKHLWTGWVRENRGSGMTVYVGAYSVVTIPGHRAPCVKVVFPLPNGNATVLMRPSIDPDGSLVLESSGHAFGDPGFYFLVRDEGSLARVRFLRTFRERIRVYVDPPDELRTDHTFTLWGARFLRLHYRLRRGVT